MRIVLVTASHMVYAPFVLTDFLQQARAQVVAVVQIEPASKRGLAAKVIRKAGARYFLVKAVDHLLTRTWTRWRHGVQGVAETAKRLGIPVHRVESVNTARSIGILQSLRCDVLYSVFSPEIFVPEVLATAPLALNYHPGKLPEYSGTAPIFWALAEGDTAIGITVHVMSPRVDEGDVVLEDSFPLRAHDSVSRAYLESCRHGARLLTRSLELVRGGGFERRPQDLARRRLFKAPDRAAYRRLRERGHRLL